jgi:hypothetical protein
VIRVILDLDRAFTDRSNSAYDARTLNAFDNLMKSGLRESVPSLSPEVFNAWRTVAPFFRGIDKAFIERTLQRLIRWHGPECEASPIPKPDDLSLAWKRGLCDAMRDARGNWRTPQIVVPSFRRSRWPDSLEVEIRMEPCGEAPLVDSRRVLIAALESYSQHPHAEADANPWDLRHIHPVQPDIEANYVCMLPMHPALIHVTLDQLSERLVGLQWEQADYRYYIPQDGWDPLGIDQATWRRGRTFPFSFREGKHGPIDRNGRIWQWHDEERHWDVQCGGPNYLSVSYSGKVLKKHGDC